MLMLAVVHELVMFHGVGHGYLALLQDGVLAWAWIELVYLAELVLQ